jgi:hypothetical protein
VGLAAASNAGALIVCRSIAWLQLGIAIRKRRATGTRIDGAVSARRGASSTSQGHPRTIFRRALGTTTSSSTVSGAALKPPHF